MRNIMALGSGMDLFYTILGLILFVGMLTMFIYGDDITIGNIFPIFSSEQHDHSFIF